KCTDIQSKLPLYSDSFDVNKDESAVKRHLTKCPLCRQKHADFREIRSSLQRISRPELPANFKSALKRAVRNELRSTNNSRRSISRQMRAWLTLGIMPYGVGVAASLLIAFTFISMMYSGAGASGPLSAAV